MVLITICIRQHRVFLKDPISDLYYLCILLMTKYCCTLNFMYNFNDKLDIEYSVWHPVQEPYFFTKKIYFYWTREVSILHILAKK